MKYLLLITLLFPLDLLASNLTLEELPTPFEGSTIFAPKGHNKNLPGILIFHGSEGGMNGRLRSQARFIARQGYVALSFCYFDCKRTASENKNELHKVDLYSAYMALLYLRELSNGKVAIYGVSRGAEKALLLSSLLAKKGLVQPAAVGVHAPSDITVIGFNPNWNHSVKWMCWEVENVSWDKTCGTPPHPITPLKSFPAWTYQGISTGLEHGNRIEIERYLGPVFVSHGTEDNVWEVGRSQRIETTLLNARFVNGGVYPEVHYFPGQGHGFDNANEIRRWSLLFDFFRRHLK